MQAYINHVPRRGARNQLPAKLGGTTEPNDSYESMPKAAEAHDEPEPQHESRGKQR